MKLFPPSSRFRPSPPLPLCLRAPSARAAPTFPAAVIEAARLSSRHPLAVSWSIATQAQLTMLRFISGGWDLGRFISGSYQVDDLTGSPLLNGSLGLMKDGMSTRVCNPLVGVEPCGAMCDGMGCALGGPVRWWVLSLSGPWPVGAVYPCAAILDAGV